MIARMVSWVQLSPKERPFALALLTVFAVLGGWWGMNAGASEMVMSVVLLFLLSAGAWAVMFALAMLLRRWKDLFWLTAALLISMGASMGGFQVGRAWHWRAITHSMEIGDGLVRALTRYQENRGHFPASLDELSPYHPTDIPGPLLRRWQFRYERATTPATGAAWGGYQLFLEVGEAFMNPDYLCYRPSQRYPQKAVRLGRWAKLYGWSGRGGPADRAYLDFVPGYGPCCPVRRAARRPERESDK